MDLVTQLAAQSRDGLLGTSELAAAGCAANTVARMVRAGALRRLHCGFYLPADQWPEDRADRHRLHSLAVLRRYGWSVAASHHSAALLHRLPVYGCDLNTVRMIRRGPGRRSAATPSGPSTGLVITDTVVDQLEQLPTVDGPAHRLWRPLR